MQDNLMIAVGRLATFSDVPGIASIVAEFQKPLTKELVESLRNPLLTLLDIPITSQIRKHNITLADTIYKILLVLAERFPKDTTCPITLEEAHEISENNLVYISTGEFFNLSTLIHSHHTRQPRHTPFNELETASFIWDEAHDSKWLVHPVTSLPFRPQDVEHIRDCCIANDIVILDLRISQEVCDSLANPVRHLTPDLLAFLNIQQMPAIEALGANIQIPFNPEVLLDVFSSFTKFSELLSNINDATKPFEKIMPRHTAIGLLCTAISQTGLLSHSIGQIVNSLGSVMILAPDANILEAPPEREIDAEHEERRGRRYGCGVSFSSLINRFTRLWSPPVNEEEQPLLPPNDLNAEDAMLLLNRDGNLVRRRRPGNAIGDFE